MKNEKKPLDFTDRIRVIANVHDLITNRYSVELEFRDVKGGWVNELLPRSIIRSGVSALDELLDRGAHLPTVPGAGAQLASLLSVVPDRTYRITGKTGWHGKSFVLPDITIGPDADTLIHATRKSSKPFELPTQGKLDGWRDGLKDPCRASSHLTFGIGLAFAGPLLHVVGQDEGAIFYLAGESSTGKTLTELAAQSVIERAVRGELLTHDVSNRAIEEACAAHNDLMLVVEEIARRIASQAELRKQLRELAHKVVGGGGSRRSAKAKQDPDLADLRWRLMSLWSGERSLDSEFLGGARERGELVRLIEVAVPLRAKNGIFDRLKDARLPPAELAKMAEAAVRENYGHPIRKFIERLVSDPDAHTRRAIELVERFLQKAKAGSDPWTHRFATKFAVVYAATRLAAELEVAPWPKSHPLKCILRLYKQARELVVTPEEALERLLQQLSQNVSSSRFPEFRKGESLPDHGTRRAWGIRSKASDGTPFLGIHSNWFDDLVKPRHYAARVRKLLADGGYILFGKEGRHVRQIKVQGFGSAEKPYFVCVPLDRLPKSPSQNDSVPKAKFNSIAQKPKSKLVNRR
jgi:putative DNA primase/helicase